MSHLLLIRILLPTAPIIVAGAKKSDVFLVCFWMKPLADPDHIGPSRTIPRRVAQAARIVGFQAVRRRRVPRSRKWPFALIRMQSIFYLINDAFIFHADAAFSFGATLPLKSNLPPVDQTARDRYLHGLHQSLETR